MENHSEVLDKELRQKCVHDLYLLGMSLTSIGESLGSPGTISNDYRLISQEEKEGRPKNERDVFRAQFLALKEFSSGRSDTYRNTMYKALRHHLSIDSLLLQLQGVAHTMNILSTPKLSPEARSWYDMFARKIFERKLRTVSEELIFEAYLEAIKEDADLLPDTRDGLFKAITGWFVASQRGNIMPIALSDDFLKDARVILESLSVRERDVLKMRFGLGMNRRTFEEIGQQFGVTRERVRQIEDKALRKLRHPNRNKKLLSYFQSSADISQALHTLRCETEELKRQRQEFENEKEAVARAIATKEMIERASSESILDMPFKEFGLSTRVRTCLNFIGISNIRALLEKSRDELMDLRNFGRGCLQEVEGKLALYGFQLRQEESGKTYSTGDHTM